MEKHDVDIQKLYIFIRLQSVYGKHNRVWQSGESEGQKSDEYMTKEGKKRKRV
jgi:hypothetical protein